MITFRRACAALLVATAVIATQTVFAHPAATTSVVVTIGGGRSFDVTINADADALIAKLDVLAAAPHGAGRSTAASDRRARLTALERTLRDRLEIRADAAFLLLTLRTVTVDATSGQAVVTFSGQLPANATVLTSRSKFIYGSYAFVLKRAGVDGETVEWLQGTQASKAYSLKEPPAAASIARAVIRAFALGYTHIMPNGLDHILFVLGLFLLNARLRPILIQVSAFTLAHSITLGLALYGIVSVPAAIVEPLIALSIVYVACENLVTSSLKPWRVALVFGFGLLHGMGFAEALAHLNLARADLLTTLVGFNIGVEAGQLSIIAGAALAMRAIAVWTPRHRALVVRPASLAIALTGAVWVVERVL